MKETLFGDNDMNNKPVFGDYDTIAHLKRAEAEADFREAVSRLLADCPLDPHTAGRIIGRSVAERARASGELADPTRFEAGIEQGLYERLR